MCDSEGVMLIVYLLLLLAAFDPLEAWAETAASSGCEKLKISGGKWEHEDDAQERDSRRCTNMHIRESDLTDNQLVLHQHGRWHEFDCIILFLPGKTHGQLVMWDTSAPLTIRTPQLHPKVGSFE